MNIAQNRVWCFIMSENMQESVELRNTTQECLSVIEATALASERLTGREGMWRRGDIHGAIEIIRVKMKNRTLPCMPLTAAALGRSLGTGIAKKHTTQGWRER